MADDIRPWLKSFVDSVGKEKTKVLLAGGGDFCATFMIFVFKSNSSRTSPSLSTNIKPFSSVIYMFEV